MKKQKDVVGFRAVLGSGLAIGVDHEFIVSEDTEKVWLEASFQRGFHFWKESLCNTISATNLL